MEALESCSLALAASILDRQDERSVLSFKLQRVTPFDPMTIAEDIARPKFPPQESQP